MATAQGPQAPPVTPGKFVYYSAADIQTLASTVKGGGQVKWSRVHRGDHDFQSFNFRAKSTAAPELHNNWADLYYIVDGEVLHHTGGTLEGGKERNPGSGEFGGGKLVGAKVVRLGAGDIASSAAGSPHWWEVEPGKTVTYITVKILKQPNLHTANATPTQFVHYKAADLRAFVDTLKRGEAIKFPTAHSIVPGLARRVCAGALLLQVPRVGSLTPRPVSAAGLCIRIHGASSIRAGPKAIRFAASLSAGQTGE
jgi:hypothetical protein